MLESAELILSDGHITKSDLPIQRNSSHNSNDTHQKYKYSNPEIYMEIQKTPNSQAILSRMANTKVTTSSVPDFELH